MKRIAAALEALAAVLIGAALAAAYAGPLRFDVLGVDLSIRTLSRPFIAAAVVIAIRVWLVRRWAVAANFAAMLASVSSGALIAAAAIGWATYLSPTCGGADSYGYVSAAERILSADLIQEEPLASVVPFDNGIRAACPLGYVPAGRVANASVPAYPLGLPALMAAANALAGRAGPFLIAPLFGLVLLIATYLTALWWYRDPQVALLASALVAMHPVVFTYAIQPMSDVPAAAALMMAVAALSKVKSLPVLGGVAAALTLLIRPALAPAALALAVPLAMARWRSSGHVVRYLTPVAIAIAAQAWMQWYLYGDMFSSGYGGVAGLFSFNTVLFNARSYSYWGFFTMGPVWLAALLIGMLVSPRLPRLALGVLVVAIVVPYLFYRPYDHWETLRFLLPVLVVATVLVAAGLLQVTRSIAGQHGALLASVLAAAIAYGWMSWLSLNNVFTMPDHEARHRLVGELVAQATPQNAVVLGLQHSGSVRYYAARQTLNWDAIPGGTLSMTTRALQDRGLAVFLIIDSEQERAMFEARHGRILDDEGWLPNGQRRSVQMFAAPDQLQQVR